MMFSIKFIQTCLFIGVMYAWVGGVNTSTQAQNLTYTPTPSNPVGRSPQAIATGDFNGDGHGDLATVNGTSDDVSVLLGNGNGTFRSAVSFGVGKIPLALVVEDMDRDGVLDLILALSGSDQVVILRGDGKGLFQKWTHQVSGKGTTFLAAHDLNGDGWTDVVAANSGRFGYYPPFNLSVLLNDGKGHLQEPVMYEQDRGKEMFPTGVFVGDLTGDAVIDLAVTWSQPSWSPANGLVSILKNTKNGTFQLFKDMKPGFTLSAIHGADIDQNGLVDLAVTSLYADTVRILLQHNPGEFYMLDPMKVGFAPVGVEIQDINQDDVLDLVVVNRDSNSLSLFVGEGTGLFATVGHFGVGATPAAVVVQDFDQDSRPDLATASTNVDGVSVLLSGGGAIPLPSMNTDALVFEQGLPSTPSAMPSPQPVRFSNIGLGPLRIDNIEISGTGAGAFAMIDNTCEGIALHTGESCSMQVAFTGQDSGTHHATLTIQDNASGSPRRVTLKGIIKG
jgi:hypothetical protein